MTVAPPRALVESFHDPDTGTFTHLVLDPATRACAVVDSVLDFDPRSGRTATRSVDRVIARVRELGATVQWVLETHVHADHLSAAPHLQQALGGQVGIGSRITAVQRTFGALLHAEPGFRPDGSAFDRLFEDGEVFHIGELPVRVMHTPGHTPACTAYVVGDGPAPAVFVGDTLFRPDHGTARCDFPGGDAATLYRSVQRLLALPPAARLYLCHDYPAAGQPPRASCTVAEQRQANIHVHEGVAESSFVAMRQARDATLAMPVLLWPSVQVNMRAGHWPPPEANGRRYLKIPLDAV